MGLTYEAVTDRSSRAEGVWGSASFSPDAETFAEPTSSPREQGPRIAT